MIERFWSKVAKPDALACWEWQSVLDKDGYGIFVLPRLNGKRPRLRAHRVAYESAIGPILDGNVVMHACDNRACCNPAHLFSGSQADNIRDMGLKSRARGGSLAGERNPSAKLSIADVLAIKKDSRRQKTIAAEFGVSLSLIAGIRAGRIWPSVGG